jgi:tetratricopeptide (TPR) repeat protein
MKKTVLLVALLALSSFAAFSQNAPAVMDLSNYGVRIEPDKRLMVVLATLDAARPLTDAGGGRAINTHLSPEGAKFRARLDSELPVPDDLRQKISVFVSQYRRQHQKATDAEILAPFVSMAYSLSAAPDLADPVVTSDLPGDLLDVLDFAPLVREFYRRSGISTKLDGYVKDYQAATNEVLRGSAKEMVSELLDYLHTKPQTVYTERVKTQTQKNKRTVLNNTEIREHDRRFFIVPEMLIPSGNITFLNIRDDYYAIVPPSTDLSLSDARRAFLQYVTDGVVLSNAKDVSGMSAGIRQLLDERRKVNPSVSPDIFLTVSRSLVAAIDARETEYQQIQAATNAVRRKLPTLKTDAEKRAATAELDKLKQTLADETALRLSEDYEKGAVLDFYFAQQLRGLEDSGFDIASSMRDMILSLDTTKETNRLAEFADARTRAATAREERRKRGTVVPGEAAVVENPVTARLLEIQKSIDAKNYSQAETDLKDLASKNPDEPRVHYNLARVTSLSAEGLADPDQQSARLREAKAQYEKVVEIYQRQSDEIASGKRVAQPIDPALVSLSYVALAKIYEFYDQNDYAVKLYDAAIKLGDVPRGGYGQAISGKQKLVSNPR